MSANGRRFDPESRLAAPQRRIACRDWMFDPVTGAILDVKPEEGVLSSPVSKHVKRLAGLHDSRTVSAGSVRHTYIR